MDICKSGAICAVSHAKINRRCLGPIENCNSDSKVAVMHSKITNEGWDLWRPIILLLVTLFCMHKTTGEV